MCAVNTRIRFTTVKLSFVPFFICQQYIVSGVLEILLALCSTFYRSMKVWCIWTLPKNCFIPRVLVRTNLIQIFKFVVDQ